MVFLSQYENVLRNTKFMGLFNQVYALNFI